MILVIDNYDSFTYNLVQYLLQLDTDVVVLRNDEFSLEKIEILSPEAIIISPGPGNPEKSSRNIKEIKECIKNIPTLGVCLGHQIIANAFGGSIKKAHRPMHGKISMITHDSKGIFTGIPSPFKVVRYHSLVVEFEKLPPSIEVSAKSSTGEIMAIRHKDLPIEGIQFHPESLLTEFGFELLTNFVRSNTNVIKDK